MPHPRAPHSEDDGYEARGSQRVHPLPQRAGRLLGRRLHLRRVLVLFGWRSQLQHGGRARARRRPPAWSAKLRPKTCSAMSAPAFGDMLMQGFGWTAILLGFGLMIGGVRRAFGIGQQDPAAWMWGLAAILFAACCLAEWPIPKSWDMSAGLGGVVGEVMLVVTVDALCGAENSRSAGLGLGPRRPLRHPVRRDGDGHGRKRRHLAVARAHQEARARRRTHAAAPSSACPPSPRAPSRNPAA